MKKTIRKIIILMVGFLLVMIFSNIELDRMISDQHKERYIVINRIQSELSVRLTQTFTENPSANLESNDKINELLKEYKQQLVTKEWLKENEVNDLGVDSIPDQIIFIPTAVAEYRDRIQTDSDTYLLSTYQKDGTLIGFIQYIYFDRMWVHAGTIMNVVCIACFFVILFIILYIDKRILKPFQRLTEYPKLLSKGQIHEKLPESKSRYFGKFVWGMNMLTDVMTGNKKKLQKLEYERQTMITAIAHGVKTPVANIKLYANAIESGLYHKDGKPDKDDVLIAQKIEKNAMDIEKLVSEMIGVSATSLCDFEPKIHSFYMKELSNLLEQEYENRLRVNRIEYQFNCNGNPIINSDKEGLFQILSQLIENAIKYGNGNPISVNMEKQEDGFYFSVKNKGSVLPEQEIPFVFQSFWRGSNAKNIEGSGIGLFVSREMAKRLGGDIFVKCWRDTSEMEFIIFLEI